MTMLAKVDGEWIEVPAEDEKVLDRYAEAVPLVWAPEYVGAPEELSWVPLYDEDGRGSFEEQPVEPGPSPLETLAERTARRLKGARLGGGGSPDAPLEALVLAAVRAHLEHAYTFTGSLHDWFTDGCGANCRATAARDTRKAADALRKAVARIAGEVIAEMEAVPAAAEAAS